MSYRYSSRFGATATAVAADIWEITAPTDAALIIHGWHVFQTSDVGDAQEEVLQLTTARATNLTTSGSGGQTVTTVPMAKGVAATGAVVEGLNTTQVATGAGAITIAEGWGWNVRIPLLVLYTPELRPIVSPGDRWVLAMPAPTDSLTVGGTLWFEEFGG